MIMQKLTLPDKKKQDSGCCFVSLGALWRSDYFLWWLIAENKTADSHPIKTTHLHWFRSSGGTKYNFESALLENIILLTPVCP